MQTEYRNRMIVGYPGMPYSSAHSSDVVTALNDYPRGQQVVEFTVDEDATDGGLEVNGINFTGSGADEGEVAEALTNAINQDPLTRAAVVAENAGDTVTVTARIGGIAFTYADGTGTTASEVAGNAEADPVPFGRAVVIEGQATDGELIARLPDTAGEVPDILGVAMATNAIAKSEGEYAVYPAQSAMNVMRMGRIYVPVEDAVSDLNAGVYVRHAEDGALDQIGGFASEAGSGLAQWEGARWLRSRQDGVAVIQIG